MTDTTRITRRNAIQFGAAGAGAAALALGANRFGASAQDGTPAADGTPVTEGGTDASLQTYPFELPELPYALDALEPVTSATTQELHHDGLHANYVTGLNAQLEDVPDAQGLTLEDLILNLDVVPEDEFEASNGVVKPRRALVRTNAGGHYNHSLWWDWLSPDGGGEPGGALSEAITTAFGDFATFQQAMKLGALGNTGSGWTWLVSDTAGALSLVVTPDQDNPLITGEGYPVFGIDNWEHSYLLDYTTASGRGEWIDALWDVVNWESVSGRYDAYLGISRTARPPR
ncbi:MAG TPA: superoxide dismutase [Thermomicrobiales bacterium]|jgi:Fe-Mn family superoxide dismutase|nr:superoxide dismutase [Thermomicrobiales bacterium]